MNDAVWLNEEEAARAIGVSPRTLERFIEAGYLKIESSPNGEKRFLSSELEKTFSISINAPETFGDVTQFNTPSETETFDEPVGEEPAVTSESYFTEDPQESPIQQPQHESKASEEPRENEEIIRLKGSINLLEKLLDRRDEEIKDLRQQREWLKERIEKLEQKADRDQILLLSETQTIKRLIALQEKKSSTWRGILQWIGLVQEDRDPTLITHEVSNNDKRESQSKAGNS